jgi:hypothetical protein
MRKVLRGRYWTTRRLITVTAPDGRKKATLLNGGSPETMARVLLRELDREKLKWILPMFQIVRPDNIWTLTSRQFMSAYGVKRPSLPHRKMSAFDPKLDERVKIQNLQTADFIEVSGRPRTSANRCWRREWDSNPRYGFP